MNTVHCALKIEFVVHLYALAQQELYNPEGNFLGSGAFGAITNALPSVDSFFLIGHF